jgi:hypothetical protein
MDTESARTPYGGPPRGTRDVRVDPERSPGCVSGVERLPTLGERVHTNEGTAVVMRILGRTGSGGRLLELSMDDGRRSPFFASAANIRVSPSVDVGSPPMAADGL